MDQGFAPRIVPDKIGQYEGSNVRIVGRVLEQDVGSQTAVLGCGENASVQVHVRLIPGQQYNSTFVEVMGVVSPDGFLEEIMSAELGDNFDLKNYQKLLEFSQDKYRHLFGDQ